MWSLRRASVSFRKQGLNDITAQVCFTTAELSSYCFEGYVIGGNGTAKRDLSVTTFHKMTCDPPSPFKGSLSFSALAGTKSSRENDDVLDEFSELNSFKTSGSIQEGNVGNESELESESEKCDEDLEGQQGEVGLSDTATRIGGTIQGQMSSPELCKALLVASRNSVCHVMDKWVEEGNALTRADIHMVLRYLRQRKLYAKALKVSEWLESSNHIEFTELDYSGQVDLIAKVHGLQVAEARIEKIAESFRNERVYQALLANCVSTFNMRKSEEVFKKMTDLRLPISCFTCNQLLLLYKRTDRKKIANVLSLMEKENVKPNLFTYRILILVKGQCDDIAGMEEVIETMKNDGVEPDVSTKCLIARIYIRCGLNEKGEAMMKDMESDPEGEKSWAFTNLLPLYAILGKEDEVSRIWKLCESNPRLEQCAAAIGAWGRLKNIEKAEEVFEIMTSKYPNMSSKKYSSLLNV
ncbi:unnamed protein product [Cuscuta campestris]|uniref:Pentacotripeptide-repeat region of PRORP domain-containing protein n=1 Tax=Cuscuta campestris TaxID=132261 RepID=A0A484MQG2_9ASTE|nr:unnamed protein product [Cuscuta campestris]